MREEFRKQKTEVKPQIARISRDFLGVGLGPATAWASLPPKAQRGKGGEWRGLAEADFFAYGNPERGADWTNAFAPNQPSANNSTHKNLCQSVKSVV
jgi:hypothetical protein